MPKIGPFEILELVGRGSMGAVYRAVDPVIGRVVALKVIRLIGYSDGEEAAYLKDRLIQEARAAGGLSHPGIVTVYQLGVEDDQAFIVMEYIDGPTLESRLTPGMPADPALRARVVLEVAAALDYAHQRGIVHRDIKPLNIMLTSSGAVKITDFGIAKTLLGRTVTQAGAILGTPYYMSPEQVRGDRLDGRSDQFALAVMAYQMLAGRRPFEGEHVTSICYQITHVEPPSPVDIDPSLTPAVARVLQRALEKNPAKRFASCAEFAAAFVEACGRTAPPASRESDAAVDNGTVLFPQSAGPAPPRPAPRSWPLQFAALKVLVTIVVLAGCTLLLRSRSTGLVPTAVPERVSPSAPVQPPESIAGLPPPADPPEEARGRIVWTGRAQKGTLLEIAGGGASTGTVYGDLPGVPVDVRVYPAERAYGRLNVLTSDQRYATPVRAATPGGLAIFSWDPRRMTDLTLWESPAPSNGWKRLVVRVNSPQLTACIVEWTTPSK